MRDENEINFKTLFGEPPLIEGESEEAYWQLYAAVEAEVKPKSIFDKMLVKDKTDKYWEEKRLKRQQADLIEAKMPRALQALHIRTNVAMDHMLFKHYFNGTEKEKKAALAYLAAQGLTPRHIRAQAIEDAQPGLLLMDRMATTREAARRHMRKELEKRKVSEVDADSDNAPVVAESESKASVN